MPDRHLVIIGGGLTGLAAGCYARASGFRTTILEHNLALGGVCTAWTRGPYVVDGCIHWLTGGPFMQLYDELGITARVPLRTLEEWATWRDLRDGTTVRITRDFDQLGAALRAISPADGDAIARMLDAADRIANLDPGVDRPPELSKVRDQLARIWDMRRSLGAVVRFRDPMGTWLPAHLKSERLRHMLLQILDGDVPALFLLMVLGYLKRGWLSRPVGGTAAFRDALVARYRELGGEVRLNATVDEILVENGRARGVRLADGSIVDADLVVSTSSMPETMLRLLGGRHGAEETRRRLEKWRLMQPVVLASFGVARPLSELPALMIASPVAPFDVGGFSNDRLYLRVCNDDPSFAPPGHSVIQTMLSTDYDWWAKRGTGYGEAKEEAARVALAQIERVVPGLRDAVRMIDVSTPLTFWKSARSWRGAYEGWIPRGENAFVHVKKTVPGVDGLYLAGQWVEPGGGVPLACMSGRQVAQLICHDLRVPFASHFARAAA